MQGSNLASVVEQAHEELRDEAARREWMKLAAVVASQMTSREFIYRLGWNFKPGGFIPAHKDLPEIKEHYELEAKAALVSHLLRQCLNGAICKVDAQYDVQGDQTFVRFSVVTKPHDCHITFPVSSR